MKLFLILFFGITSFTQLIAQKKDTIFTHIKKWQWELNKEYKNVNTSPLSAEDRKKFTIHSFYKIDTQYRVVANLEILDIDSIVKIKTTQNLTQEFKLYAVAHFSLSGKALQLNVYQSKMLMTTKGYENYLFLPFSDETNGFSTYGGGRFIDLRIPADKKIIIDFNKAYNPYCAYSNKYNCPKIPEANHLPIEVKAGIQLKSKSISN